MKKPLLFVLFLFSSYFAQHSSAQCYVRLEDASGFNTDPYQAELQAAAAKLCAIFDTTGFAGQFKVYDFGFYLHQEHTTGGYPEPFAQKIQEVQALSPYYLLFGKQTDRTGVYTRFWVDLVLPDTGVYQCLDMAKLAAVKLGLKNNISLTYLEDNNLFSRYANAEISAIKFLLVTLDAIRNGNCCVPTDEVVDSWLLAQDFVKLNIINSSINNPMVLDSVILRQNTSAKNLNNYVTDYSNYLIEINGSQIVLGEAINACISASNYSTSNIQVFIIKNISLCNGDYELAMSQLSSNLPNLGGIVYIQNKSIGPDDIFIKVIGMENSEIPNIITNFDGNDNAPPDCGATNFQDLVNTIRQAEDSFTNIWK